MPKRNDLLGKKFNRLTAVSSFVENGKLMWMCLCDCGKMAQLRSTSLKTGRTKSCGCLAKEMQSLRALKRNFVHGHNIAGAETRTHKSWVSMIERCGRENHISFPRYGGRGITVCERWKSFVNFLEDMGERPEGKTLDRKNVNEGYSKENCKWASLSEQQRNRTDSFYITCGDETKHVAEWSLLSGIKANTIRERILRGWPAHKSIYSPIKRRKP